MKVYLTKPVKIKGKWHKSGSEVDVPKNEAQRLGKKNACVIPLTEVPSSKAEAED